jgi:hypothetical protein
MFDFDHPSFSFGAFILDPNTGEPVGGFGW